METPKEEKYNQEEGFNPIPTPTLTDQESPIMFCSGKKLSMETLKEEKYNQEEGFNPIPTPTLIDQESPPIMFSDSCSMCGSKKRTCLTPSFGQTKKTILIDPSSMKEAASSTDDERSHSRLSSSPSSFFHQIPNSSPSLCRSVSDMSSFGLSGSFSSPKSLENADNSVHKSDDQNLVGSERFGEEIEHGNTLLQKMTSNEEKDLSPTDQKSPIDSCSMCGSKKRSSMKEASDRSSFALSGFFSSPKSAAAIPKSPTATPTHSVQKSDDQKPIGDQKPIVEGVLAATTTSTDHPKHQQLTVHTNLNRINELSYDMLNYLISYLPPQDRAKIPILSKTLLTSFTPNPIHIDSSIIQSWNPLFLEIDCDRLDRLLTWLSHRERYECMLWFIQSLLMEHKDMDKLRLVGRVGMLGKCLKPNQFGFLKSIHCYSVRIASVQEMVAISTCLEDLQLQNCQVPSYFRLRLGLNSDFRKLVMKNCLGLMNENISHVILHVPTLVKFEFHGSIPFFNLSGVRKLVEAEIKLMELLLTSMVLGHERVLGLLNSLKNVQILRVCSIFLKHLREINEGSQMIYPNVKDLHLSISMKEDAEVDLASLLISVPNLDRLFIGVEGSWTCLWRSHHVPLEQLSYFWMGPLRGVPAELEFIKHVLTNAKVLKNAEIVVLYGVRTSMRRNERAEENLTKAFNNATRFKELILSHPRCSLEAELNVKVQFSCSGGKHYQR